MAWPCTLGFRCPYRCYDDEGLGIVCIHPDIEPEEDKMYGYAEEWPLCPLIEDGPLLDYLLSDGRSSRDAGGECKLRIPCKTAFDSFDLDAWVEDGSVAIRAFGIFWSLSYADCRALVSDIETALAADGERTYLSRFDVEYDDDYDDIHILQGKSDLVIRWEDAAVLCNWLREAVA